MRHQFRRKKSPGPMKTIYHTHPIPAALRAALSGEENLLVLALRPGDESLHCGGLIARCCRRGRPPFVVVLSDGSTLSTSPQHMPPDALAHRHEQETRAAMRCLGLPPQRLLMGGLFDNTVPASGPAFDDLARGIAMIMWARDCNILCVAAEHQTSATPEVVSRIAVEVVRHSGVGLLCCQLVSAQPGPGSAGDPALQHRLDIAPDLPAKRAALAAHSTRFRIPPDPPSYEAFSRFEPPRIA
jgi:LmbE family N-acetylglucosaminyl deacetylase